MTDCVTNVLQREKVKGLRSRKPFTLLVGPPGLEPGTT